MTIVPEARSWVPIVMSIEVMFSGILHCSLKELYDSINPEVTYGTFYLCYKRHLNADAQLNEKGFVDELRSLSAKRFKRVGGKTTKTKSKRQFVYNGVSYKSLSALFHSIDERSVSYATFLSRTKDNIGYLEAATSASAMAPMVELTANGITHASLAEFASAHNLPYMLAYSRLRRGYTPDEIISGKQVVKKDRPITVNSIKYESVEVALKSLCPDQKLKTVKNRLAKGWPPEEAFELKSRPAINGRSASTYEYKNKLYTAKELALMFNVSQLHLSKLLVSGLAVEDAISKFTGGRRCLPNRPVQSGPFYVDGMAFKRLIDVSNHFGVNYTLLYNRINITGWTVKEAVEGKLNFEYDGQKYSSPKEVWKNHGCVPYSVFATRYQVGQEMDVCLGKATHPMTHLDGNYVIDGVTFRTHDDICKYLGISRGGLVSRLKTMGLQEAVDDIRLTAKCKGRYNDKYFVKYPEMKGVKGNFYFISFEVNGVVLHKVGVTRRDVTSRFYGKSECSVIKTASGSLHDMYMLEQEIIRKFSSFKHKAERFFEGRTELFKLTKEEEAKVVEYIKTAAWDN